MSEKLKRLAKQSAAFGAALAVSALPLLARATTDRSALLKKVADAGYGSTSSGDLMTMLGTFIAVLLTLLGVILVLLVIYGGFIWMTSQGAADKIKKGKDMIIQAIIGMIIVFAAYAIANFIMKTANIITTSGDASSLSS